MNALKKFIKKNETLFFFFTYFFASIVFDEILLNAFTVAFSAGFPFYMFLFSLNISFLLALICAPFGAKARTVISFVLATLIYLIFAIQLVYHGFCTSFLQIAQLGMGGDAMGAFGDAMWLEILESLGALLLFLIPIIALVVFTVLKFTHGKKSSLKSLLCGAIVFFLLHFGAVFALPIAGRDFLSPYNVYHKNLKVDFAVEYFGALTTARLDLRNMFFGVKIDLVTDGEGNAVGNVTDIDFAKLAENEENEEIKELHRFFASENATNTNSFTGMFEGYNLIVIAAESFTHHVIDKKITPTLYKMANEGFIFNNYYNTVSDNTSNGEYALLTGLVPDTSLLGQGWKTFYNYNSFTTSKDNLMPFALGNQYVWNGGKAFAVHNHTASYYGRNKTHPNLGYEFLAFGQGLEKVETYPTSDVSMMEQSLPVILERDEDGNIEPFHAYFLTFSGHMPYVFDETHNDMTVKNKKFVEKLPYSKRLQAYIACQLELEFALEYLLDELKAAGVLENTLIAITNDHYPYPLDSINDSDDLIYLSELAKRKLDNYWDTYRSGLILWSASMEEAIEVDAPMCSLDVLPTISNLLGLTYDSRLLAGKDIFSDTEHVAILQDYSFVTDKVMFNATTGKVTLQKGVASLEDGYLERIQNEVQKRFAMSAKVLYNDYYRVVYE